MAAPTLVSTTELTWSGTTSPRTSASITVQAGDRLVVKASGSTSNGALSVSDSASLTWSTTSDTTSGYNPVYLSTSSAVAASGTLTVTVTRASGSSYFGAEIEVWRASDGFGTPVNGRGSSSAPSLAITTTAANSAISYLNSDNNSSSVSGRAWRTINSASPTEQQASTPGSTFFVGTWTDAGAAGSKTAGLTTPSSQKWAALAVEVLAQSATPALGTDGGTLSATETASVAVLASVSGTDSGTLSASEASTVAAVLSRTDTGTISATEARTLAADTTTSDAGTLSATETATLSIAAVVTRADTGTVGATERASVRKAASRSQLAWPWQDPAFRAAWPVDTRSDDWEAAIAARARTITGWAELVDVHGNPLPITTDTGQTRWRLPLSGASVSYRASERRQVESFSASLSFEAPWMIPASSQHPLWGASGALIRLWWSIWSRRRGAWLSRPLATLAIGDTDAVDLGIISGTLRGRDVMATMVGYGRGAPNVVGQTVDKAIATIFARSAPTIPVRIAPTSVVVPEGTVLRDPQSDVADLADMGWDTGIVEADLLGVVNVGPRPEPPGPPLAWQEGTGCPVSEIRWKHGVTAMGNAVTAVSTHPDAVGLSVTVSDDDPTSPTYVGGPWGVHPLKPVESPLATTTAALTSVALGALDAGLHPTEDVELTVPQRPDLYGQRPARVGRKPLGLSGITRVSSWTLNLGTPDPMRVGMTQRSV